MKKLQREKIVNLTIITLLSMLILAGCGRSGNDTTVVEESIQETGTEQAETATEDESGIVDTNSLAEETGKTIKILYTNDVHAHIDGEEGHLSYASVAARKAELEQEGYQVLLVDAGDHAQGSAFSGLDQGGTVIEIMNAVGYDVAALGNHEFDYGIERTLQLADYASFPYVACNFKEETTMKTVVEPYHVFELGDLKVAILGILTPETLTKSTPAYFQDENGRYLYYFAAGDDGLELYDTVQETIDQAAEEADIVIALGHLGSEASSKPYTARDVIANTTGLSAFIDGHSHEMIPLTEVEDLQGNSVVLTQSGEYFETFGEMTITPDGKITSKLIDSYDKQDESVLAMEKNMLEFVDLQFGRVLGNLDNTLCYNDPDTGYRIVRRQETNLGDFVADSIYSYFNLSLGNPCDVVLVNAGGLRSEIAQGEVTYLDCKNVEPFGNTICLVEVSGQTLLDALEMGARNIGVTDEETGKPAELGGFWQVAGIRFTINTTKAVELKLNKDNCWVSGPANPEDYRVQNVEIYHPDTDSYEPLDLTKNYRIGGFDYYLLNSGDGMTMFKNSELVVNYVGEDYLILSDYVSGFAAEGELARITSAGSPLSVYGNYQIDYEDPYGSERISIILE